MRHIYTFLSSTAFIHVVCLLWFAGLPFSKAVSSSVLGTLFGIGMLGVLIQGPRVVLSQYRAAQNMRLYAPILCFCVLWVAYLAGMAYTSNCYVGGLFLWKQIPLLLTPWVLVFYYEHLQQQHRLYLWVFVVANLVAGGLTIFLYSLPDNTVARIAGFWGLMPFEQGSDRAYFGLYSPFIERIQFANLLGLALLSALWLAGTGVVRKERLMAGLSVLLLFICMLILGGRGSLLGVLLGIGVWGMGQIYNSRYWVRFSTKFGRRLMAVLVGVLLWGALAGMSYMAIRYVEPVKKRYMQLYWELDSYYNGTFTQYNYVEFTSIRRLLSWQKHALLIQKNPILGVGTGDYRIELQKLYEQDALGFPPNAHHQLLQIWATIGIWGLLVFGAILYYWLRAVRRQNDTCNTLWAYSFLAFYLLLFSTDSALSSQMGLTVFVLFAGLIALDKNKKILGKLAK